MRFSLTACVLATVLVFASATDSDADTVFTTGINSSTTSSPTNITFGNYSGGGVTSIDSAGLQVRNLDTIGGHEGDVTFNFTNAALGTSDYVVVWIERSTVGTGNNTARVLSVDGTSVASWTAVTIATQGTLASYKLPFTLSSPDSSVSTVTIRFNMTTGVSTLDIDAVATPEPGTFALLGLGILGTAAWARRRRKVVGKS
jgi:hypothetical protein